MKCMCKDFRNKNTPGPCNCGRYIKVEVNDE
nr:MAG TPA: Ferredoxin thioredoxin reductase catalytic beta chain [Caudoviricetes sp.]